MDDVVDKDGNLKNAEDDHGKWRWEKLHLILVRAI